MFVSIAGLGIRFNMKIFVVVLIGTYPADTVVLIGSYPVSIHNIIIQRIK